VENIMDLLGEFSASELADGIDEGIRLDSPRRRNNNGGYLVVLVLSIHPAYPLEKGYNESKRFPGASYCLKTIQSQLFYQMNGGGPTSTTQS